MSFDDDEIGIETSQPREYFRVTYGTTTIRMVHGQRDLVVAGELFTAQPVARLDLQLDIITAELGRELVVPPKHPLVTRWLALFTPPQRVRVQAYRLQLNSGETEQLWDGEITSLKFENNEAKFLVPSRASRATDRRVPTVLVDTLCGAMLFDGWCKVDRVSNTFAAHVTFVDGRNVNVAFDVSQPAGDGWADRGEFIHLPSGEPMLIISQVGLQIVMRSPIPGMKVGDHVTLSRGCDHTLGTCKNTFSNVVNYVGLPARPTRNPFFPTGLGVGESK